MNKIFKLIILNSVPLVILYYLYREGVVELAYSHDVLYIMWGILFLFVVGILGVLWGARTVGEWCSESCVVLGFLGTAYGIWLAFGELDPNTIGEVAQIGSILSTLLSGLGAAIWTTIVGALLATWLSLNVEFVK